MDVYPKNRQIVLRSGGEKNAFQSALTNIYGPDHEVVSEMVSVRESYTNLHLSVLSGNDRHERAAYFEYDLPIFIFLNPIRYQQIKTALGFMSDQQLTDLEMDYYSEFGVDPNSVKRRKIFAATSAYILNDLLFMEDKILQYLNELDHDSAT